mmetsp:Transcript_73726/g.205053  ORF Transcript_73726/g.205053 Transcript_73726/m.205053 type:complete len:437 (-) Transcript_73726:64-1374(-)
MMQCARFLVRVVLLAFTLAAPLRAFRLRRDANLFKLAGKRSNRSTVRRLSSDIPGFYHTTEEIRQELQELAADCPGMELKSVKSMSDDGQERVVDVATIRGGGDKPLNRNFFLFGEHARELISAESGLHFVKSLCGKTSLAERAREVLRENDFQIVVNGNPGSRPHVEEGNSCLRVSPSGVDLNRNWAYNWQAESVMDPADTNPGPTPFSEPETRTFKELVQDFKPTTFLTVHSGTRGMYMPWAYDMEHLASRNEPEMMDILKKLDEDHCECPFGAAGREVGYSCPGTCLDWVYDALKTPYAFAFEIYAGAEHTASLRQRWREKMASGGAFYQTHKHLGHPFFNDVFANHPSSFVQVRAGHALERAWDSQSVAECFAQFNPGAEDEYKSVLNNWSGAYLDMASMVVSKLKAGPAGVPVPVDTNVLGQETVDAFVTH